MRALIRILAGVLLFFCVDAALFRTGLYTPWLEPSSSAGMLQLMLLRERQHQAEWKEQLVLTMGDSRMNYSAKLANEYLASKGAKFRLTHGGVAGTTPRIWYYILRELDPTATRYRAIVLPVEGYDDEDTYVDFSDYPLDANYLSPLLRWTDVPEYPLSYTTPQYAREAWKACLLKGAALQADLLAMLISPASRVRSAKLNRSWWPGGSYEYVETEKDVVGLAIDWKTRTASAPAGVDMNVVKTMLLRPDAPQTGKFGAYRRRWFGKIIERYRNSQTRLIFVMLPRGPFVRPAVKPVSASIREFASQKNVLLGDERRFESLERPEMFHDALHMNRAGSTRYGQMLADDLAGMLSAL